MVSLITSGLSFFYGGMVSKKNVISTLMPAFIATGLISIIWVVVGISLAFGDSKGGLIGDPTTYFFFNNVGSGGAWGTIPLLLFALFQLKFAVITPALVV